MQIKRKCANNICSNVWTNSRGVLLILCGDLSPCPSSFYGFSVVLYLWDSSFFPYIFHPFIPYLFFKSFFTLFYNLVYYFFLYFLSIFSSYHLFLITVMAPPSSSAWFLSFNSFVSSHLYDVSMQYRKGKGGWLRKGEVRRKVSYVSIAWMAVSLCHWNIVTWV